MCILFFYKHLIINLFLWFQSRSTFYSVILTKKIQLKVRVVSEVKMLSFLWPFHCRELHVLNCRPAIWEHNLLWINYLFIFYRVIAQLIPGNLFPYCILMSGITLFCLFLIKQGGNELQAKIGQMLNSKCCWIKSMCSSLLYSDLFSSVSYSVSQINENTINHYLVKENQLNGNHA